ncbi:S-DNA-T family DNA segregation ATPase FtsK/SpoIIIE [Bacillus oleivorans]|uniref:S-DNA-T family DNA segregation ATPase FtsK/SpoIIIE n=1 Tax=Bacillus oleivorans TaxID=1448271 RepID=A0A285CWC9_9BACI|nr:DNA translocase FtsK [Bacillus oleivorans]SNX71378.1 S-DNA-T family DNA segregation ATPase FtsK/SpoIIIE [Bacillus oleivorans]
MNFFHKWIQKIKKQEEEQSVLEEYLKERPFINPEESRGKDVEARITYQYPKGQFRFPLISDEELHRKRHQTTRRHLEKEQSIPIRERRRARSEQKEDKQSPIKEEIQKKMEMKKGPKKPFSPTQIPSPIYGFHSRTENNSLLISNLKREKSPIPNYSENTYEKGFFTEILGEQIETIEKTDEVILSVSHNGEITDEEREVPVTGSERKLSIINEFDPEPPFAQIESKEEAFYEETEETNEIEEEIEVNTEADHMEAGEFRVLYDNDEPEEGQETPEAIYYSRRIDNERNEEAAAAIETAENEENGESRESTRPHLPFNVIMLKQDKLKWERRNEKQPSGPVMQQTEKMVPETKSYLFPSQQLLTPPAGEADQGDWIEGQAHILNQTLEYFHVKARVVNYSQGPSVTRFEVSPEPGVKVNKITNLTDDLKLSLAARDIRMEAPIPGKHTIGIEIPNLKSRPVHLREITEHPKFTESSSPLTVALGLSISGEPVVTDLKKMPHGLIAGATGSGKSVCINSVLVSLLYKAHPDQVKLLLIDPKMVELTPYNGIPHLVSPVITDVKAATSSLKWAVQEMESRYDEFAKTGVRDIEKYNQLFPDNTLPYVVIVIDELADLMMAAPADVEDAICRIAQKARACGIHLIIATQRPSVDVITGLIKANVPTRIAFSVSSQVDSRTIIDTSGAERLLGKGDMLFLENGASKPVRLQGTFVSDTEIDAVVQHVSMQQEADYLFRQEELLQKAQIADEEDELFMEACQFVIDQGNASTSLLQRRFRIGYNRAARLIEMMESQGIVSGANGTKPRDVLVSEDELAIQSDQ